MITIITWCSDSALRTITIAPEMADIAQIAEPVESAEPDEPAGPDEPAVTPLDPVM